MNQSNTVTSEPQRQLNIHSPFVAQTAARTSQPMASARGQSRSGKACAKKIKTKRPVKGRQTDGSKQDRVIALLRRREGATLAALLKATGWKRHSIRGFLAGSVRKKLKLPLISEKLDAPNLSDRDRQNREKGQRCWRMTPICPQSSKVALPDRIKKRHTKPGPKTPSFMRE